MTRILYVLAGIRGQKTPKPAYFPKKTCRVFSLRKLILHVLRDNHMSEWNACFFRIRKKPWDRMNDKWSFFQEREKPKVRVKKYNPDLHKIGIRPKIEWLLPFIWKNPGCVNEWMSDELSKKNCDTFDANHCNSLLIVMPNCPILRPSCWNFKV